jgi:hypothetical protein
VAALLPAGKPPTMPCLEGPSNVRTAFPQSVASVTSPQSGASVVISHRQPHNHRLGTSDNLPSDSPAAAPVDHGRARTEAPPAELELVARATIIAHLVRKIAHLVRKLSTQPPGTTWCDAIVTLRSIIEQGGTKGCISPRSGYCFRLPRGCGWHRQPVARPAVGRDPARQRQTHSLK